MTRISPRLSLLAAATASAALLASACGAAEADYYRPHPAGGAPSQPHAGENYEAEEENSFIDAAEEDTSTFSIDVDTGSYTLMRSDINAERLPAKDGVRPEEYINFFQYDYRPPEPDGDPFSVHTEAAPSPFGEEGMKLMRVGLKGREIPSDDLRPANLVFLIDVSGSMRGKKKLGMVKESLNSLVDHLRPTDRIGIVVYAGSSGVVLEPTEVKKERKIKRAIRKLKSGGSTNGEAGIVNAYKLAETYRKENGINRVILCTDGDFNVGKTGDSLVELIKEYRKKHISLTTVGFGRGNYNDAVMENLARDGNGNYFYIDSKQEARRIFGTELASTLEVIAADVKIQVEFNSEVVKRYRLVGYENRKLDNEDFEDDKKDAGEIGPGHTVTAYYELEMAEGASQAAADSPLSIVRLRYKEAYGQDSKQLDRPLTIDQLKAHFDEATPGFRFGAAVTEYAEILRRSKHSTGARFADLIEIAQGAMTNRDSERKRRTEFIELLQAARQLWMSN